MGETQGPSRRARAGGDVILVVDDEEDVLRLMVTILAPAGYQVVVAQDTASALAAATGQDIDAALVDLQLGAEEGMDLVALLTGGTDRSGTEPAVLVVTAATEPASLVEALGAGAVDYVRKPFDRSELLARLQSALRSKRAYEAASGDRDPPTSRARRHHALTTAEQAVAQRAAQGLTNRAIAAELFVSIKAVEFHLGHTFQKLGVSNRTQLTRLMLEARATIAS